MSYVPLRQTKAEIMQGIEAVSSKVIANNTVEYYRKDGTRVVRFHNVDVVEEKDGIMTLFSGGFRTPTTKERISSQVRKYGWSVWSEDRIWYLGRSGYSLPAWGFTEGMKINKKEVVEGGMSAEDISKIRTLHKQVKKYARDYVSSLLKGEVPAPSSGDCMICRIRELEDSDGPKHLQSHIEEPYYVPSLLVNAMCRHPVSKVAQWTIGELWSGKETCNRHTSMDEVVGIQLRGSIEQYMRHGLGI